MNWEPPLSNPMHWKPGHSAMACAQCREDAVTKASSGLPLDISWIVGREGRPILTIPEHRGFNPGGTRPSQSDVFALLAMAEGACTLTVEALEDGPFGDSISD